MRSVGIARLVDITGRADLDNPRLKFYDCFAVDHMQETRRRLATVDALAARCRACDTRVELHAIAAGADGRCPNCSTSFSEGWTLLLIEECGAVEHLVAALVRSLRRLCGLPGNL